MIFNQKIKKKDFLEKICYKNRTMGKSLLKAVKNCNKLLKSIEKNFFFQSLSKTVKSVYLPSPLTLLKN